MANNLGLIIINSLCLPACWAGPQKGWQSRGQVRQTNTQKHQPTMSLPLTIDPNHIITNIRRRKIDISACQKHFGYSVLLFLSGLLNVKQILPSIRVQHLSAFSPLISRFESSSKFLPHQPHVMIWKWESKPLPVVWENPIAGDNIFQNPVFPSWRKTLFTTQVVILPVAEIHQEKVLPFKLFKFRVWTNIFYFHLNLNSPF